MKTVSDIVPYIVNDSFRGLPSGKLAWNGRVCGETKDHWQRRHPLAYHGL